jgi:O-antigen biosynthesis protein
VPSFFLTPSPAVLFTRELRLNPPVISIVIVHFKVPDFLIRALRSLRQALLYDQSEVIIVDNASMDDSKQRITQEFPEVTWIDLKSNIGFGKACNVGAKSAAGTYLLFLNPDTEVSQNTLSESVALLRARPDVGLLGPEILNPDGTLQVSCRRSFPTPAIAFYRLFGLSRIFPKSKKFGQYNLSYLDPKQECEVDAVSGSFMCMPRALFQDIGGFDEAFFMYGEDLDICFRVKEKGYKVWYTPRTQIIHFKGRSSSKQSFKSRKAWYEAMLIFSRKYRHIHKSFLPGWLIAAGIAFRAAITVITSLFRTSIATLIDFALINAILFIGISLRFVLSGKPSPYSGSHFFILIGMHILLTASFIVSFAVRGVYSKERYSVGNAFISGAGASVIFMSGVYFVPSMAFSRIAFLLSAVCIMLMLVAWREMLPFLVGRLKRMIYSTGNVIVLGNDAVAALLIKNVEEDSTAHIKGILWPSQEKFPGEFKGYPVLGTLENIRSVLEWGGIDLLLIATAQPWYSYVIEALASSKVKNLTIRWVPPELFAKAPEQLPIVIPLRDFAV